MSSAAAAPEPRDLASQLASIDAAAMADRQAMAREAAARSNARRRVRRRRRPDMVEAGPLTTPVEAIADDVGNPDALIAALGELAARPLEDRVGDQMRALLDRATSPMVRAALATGLGVTRAAGTPLRLVRPGDAEGARVSVVAEAAGETPPVERPSVRRDAPNSPGLGSAPCDAQPSQLPVVKGAKE